jgi:hypothetical protein
MFHGTKLDCRLQDANLCQSPDCYICSIIEAGFNTTQYGSFSSSFASHSNGFARKYGEAEMYGMLLCSVITPAGRVGSFLKVTEVVVHEKNAILPRYVILFSP